METPVQIAVGNLHEQPSPDTLLERSDPMYRSFRWNMFAPMLLLAFLLPILAACGGGPQVAPGAAAVPAAPTAEAMRAAPGSGAMACPGQNQVAIKNFSFTPATLTVAAGTTMTWTNHDDVPHTVTAADKSYTSGAIDTDGTFSPQFTTPGTYKYFCSIHPTMTAQIIVK